MHMQTWCHLWATRQEKITNIGGVSSIAMVHILYYSFKLMFGMCELPGESVVCKQCLHGHSTCRQSTFSMSPNLFVGLCLSTHYTIPIITFTLCFVLFKYLVAKQHSTNTGTVLVCRISHLPALFPSLYTLRTAINSLIAINFLYADTYRACSKWPYCLHTVIIFYRYGKVCQNNCRILPYILSVC